MCNEAKLKISEIKQKVLESICEQSDIFCKRDIINDIIDHTEIVENQVDAMVEHVDHAINILYEGGDLGNNQYNNTFFWIKS